MTQGLINTIAQNNSFNYSGNICRENNSYTPFYFLSVMYYQNSMSVPY